MKASEAIKEIQRLIEKYCDFDLKVRQDPLTADAGEYSEEIQIYVDSLNQTILIQGD